MNKNLFVWDILSIKDFKKKLGSADNLKDELFTNSEINYCRNDISSLAARYSAKCAVKKLVNKEIPWREINIVNSFNGSPKVEDMADVKISISHDGDYAVSFAANDDKKIGIGVDVISEKRILNLGEKYMSKIIKRISGEKERKQIKTIEDFAKIWAGKEAILKALGVGMWNGISLSEIEILSKNKKYFVGLLGRAKDKAKNENLYNWEINFRKEKEYIFAFVIAN